MAVFLSQVEKISASLNLALKSRYFLRQNLQDNHSNESWNWIVNSSIPRTLSPFFETFIAVFPDPTDRPWVSKRIKSILHMLFTRWWKGYFGSYPFE